MHCSTGTSAGEACSDPKRRSSLLPAHSSPFFMSLFVQFGGADIWTSRTEHLAVTHYRIRLQRGARWSHVTQMPAGWGQLPTVQRRRHAGQRSLGARPAAQKPPPVPPWVTATTPRWGFASLPGFGRVARTSLGGTACEMTLLHGLLGKAEDLELCQLGSCTSSHSFAVRESFPLVIF